ncbi:hypothetical protein [Brevibacterium paucivorans]|uniref:hypothetical protein n=1 Tax=Brevibacterium paucivorans TaxID=170994 RepID=UPI003219702D
MTTGRKAVTKAKKWRGHREKPVNRTPLNDRFYGRKVSGSAYPWCAVYTSLMYRDIGLRANVDYPHSAGVAVCFAWYRRKGRIISKRRLKPGDQVRYTFSHTGIFSHYDRRGNAVVWEGNTSGSSRGSQRDGGGVHLRTRRLSLIQYGGRPFFRATNPAPKPAKPAPKPAPKKEEDIIMPIIATGANKTSRVIKPGQTTRIPMGKYYSMATVSRGDTVKPTCRVSVQGLPADGRLAVSAKIVDFVKGGSPQDKIVGNFFTQDYTGGDKWTDIVYTGQAYKVSQSPRKGGSLRLQLQVRNRSSEPVTITATEFTVEGMK